MALVMNRREAWSILQTECKKVTMCVECPLHQYKEEHGYDTLEVRCIEVMRVAGNKLLEGEDDLK